MIFKLYPYVIKHRGSISYLKHVVNVTRNKETISKTPSGKVLAAANQAQSHKNTSPQSKNEKEVEAMPTVFYTHAKPQSSIKNTTFPENCSEIQLNLKPVFKPDVTATVMDNNIEETLSNIERNEVKLVNAVSPANLDWQKQILELKHLPKHYKSLSKFRLTGLVVLTTVAGYGMAPGAFDAATLVYLILGTGLTSSAANAVNQVLEVPYDSQMVRTKNRVLIRGVITPLHASVFATCSAITGLSVLYAGASSTTALLGLTNLILYTSLYTPMKRVSIANTWVGSVVGAIPPLMGWAAATGGTLSAGAVLMAAILYSWQFPHFNALSWNLRADYSRAGYRMTSVVDPALCQRVALRHSVALLALCSAAPLLDLTTWSFAIDSLPLNCFLIYYSWLFHKNGDSNSARKLFRLSLIYLPILMSLMLLGKKHSSSSEKLKRRTDEISN